MEKTTVYLSLELKTALRRVATRRGVSEAALIREALQAAVTRDRPAPRGGLFAGETPIARDVDRHLEGFGEG